MRASLAGLAAPGGLRGARRAKAPDRALDARGAG